MRSDTNPVDEGSAWYSCAALRFGYETGRIVVDDISIAMARGSLTAIIGANGCGKSTLIRLLAGLLKPNAGTVRYQGRDLLKWDRRALARQIAYVPQSISKAFPFTSLEVVLTGRTPYSSPFRLENAHDLELARAALDTVGVRHLEQRRVTELSGGERQLVSVARALAQDPGCLLLDEPSSSLDLKHRAGLIRSLSTLRKQKGMTVLMVTHDLNLLEPGFDHVFALRAGKLVASGAPGEVLQDATLANVYDDPYVRARRLDGQLCVWSEVHG